MNFKGQNRRMFRKPGAAKRALGILASSQELANTVEPMRMADGGNVSNPAYTEREQKFLDFAYEYQPEKNPLKEQFERMTGEKYVDPIKELLMKSALKVQQGLPLEVNGTFISDGNPMRRKAAAAARDSELGAPDPLRMANGGLAEIEQVKAEIADAQGEFNEALTFRNTIARDNALSIAQQRIERANQRLAELRETVGRDAAVGRPVQASPQMKTSYFDPTRPSPGEGLRPKSSPDDSILERFGKTIGSGLLSTAQLPFNAVKGARTIGRNVESVLTEPGGADSFGDSFGDMSARADQLQDENAKELAQKAGILPEDKKSPEPSTDDLINALNKLGGSSPEKDTSTADLFLRIGLSIAAGQDRNALTNIAAGTLAALQESEKIGLLKDRQRPKIQQTLDYFKTAGLNENEVQAILPYALGTTKRDSESERVVADMQAAAQRGDVATLTTILLQQQGQNADTDLAREQAEALIKQFSGVGSKN